MRGLVLASLLVACHEAPPPVVANKPVTVKPGFSGNDLDVIPVESELVIGVNWKQAISTPLYTELIVPHLAESGIEELRAACGFDPLATATSMTLGARGLGDADPDLVAVFHGFDRAAVLACAGKLQPKMAEHGDKIVIDGDTVVASGGNGKGVYALTFLDEHTMVLATGTRANKAGVTALATLKSSVRTSPAFSEMLAKTRTNATAWGVMSGTSRLLGQMPVHLRAVVGALEASDGIAGDLHLLVSNPSEAAELAKLLTTQAAQVQPFVNHFDVLATGAQVDVRVTLSHAKVTALAKMF